MKSFIGTCVENPFNRIDDLCNIVEEGKKISKKEFFNNCYLEEDIIKNIKLYPHDYEFLRSGNIFFFRHSAIEYFYQ